MEYDLLFQTTFAPEGGERILAYVTHEFEASLLQFARCVAYHWRCNGRNSVQTARDQRRQIVVLAREGEASRWIEQPEFKEYQCGCAGRA